MDIKEKIKQNKSLFGFSLLLIIFFISMYIIQSKQPQTYLPYTSKSPAPTGTKAIYTYVKDNSQSVKRWSQQPERLPTNVSGQLLILVEPFYTLSSEEINEYERFVESGNTLFLAQNTPLPIFDFEIKDEEYDTVYNHENQEYKLENSSYLRFNLENHDEKLLVDGDGDAIAVRRQIGEGEIIATLIPDVMMNQNILKADHIPLLIYLLNEMNYDTVYFDESIYYEQSAFSQFDPYPHWFILLLLQLTIIALLWLLLKGKRFGPIQMVREDTVRFSDESIRAVANWYIRSGEYRDSLLIQTDYLKMLFAEKWGISSQQQWAEYRDQLVMRRPELDKNEINVFFSQIDAVLKKEKISKQEYLLWSKRIDKVRREIEQ